jgi:hypothetical protein
MSGQPEGRKGVREIDVRGPRFSASLTFLVLSAAYLLKSPGLLAFQVVVFGVAAFAGLRWSPYGNVFRFLKRNLSFIGPPPATEPESGPRFSQLMGFVFTAAGLAFLTNGADTVGWALVLVVVGLSALLAFTGICVGCEMYALGQRMRGKAA